VPIIGKRPEQLIKFAAGWHDRERSHMVPRDQRRSRG
jgi:hypothetical protein